MWLELYRSQFPLETPNTKHWRKKKEKRKLKSWIAQIIALIPSKFQLVFQNSNPNTRLVSCRSWKFSSPVQYKMKTLQKTTKLQNPPEKSEQLYLHLLLPHLQHQRLDKTKIPPKSPTKHAIKLKKSQKIKINYNN